MSTVQSGDRVAVHFTGYHADGSPFGTSRGGEPLTFVVGSDEVIAGLSEALVGMQAGERKRVTVPPERGYGLRNPELTLKVPRAVVGDSQPGSAIRTDLDGRTVVLWLVAMDDAVATLDANHPLAGETLTYDLELVTVESR
jgi:FKBP-type peptidyl-prolyl cis-trans isomerase 2